VSRLDEIESRSSTERTRFIERGRQRPSAEAARSPRPCRGKANRAAKRVERAAVDQDARPARLVGKMMKPLERPEGDGKGA
jgi:hypothetical protein